MTTAELLDIAAAQIAHVSPDTYCYYGLFVTDKQLHCQPLKNRQLKDLEIFRFLPSIVKNGLTSSEWDHLEAELAVLQQEGVL